MDFLEVSFEEEVVTTEYGENANPGASSSSMVFIMNVSRSRYVKSLPQFSKVLYHYGQTSISKDTIEIKKTQNKTTIQNNNNNKKKTCQLMSCITSGLDTAIFAYVKN